MKIPGHSGDSSWITGGAGEHHGMEIPGDTSSSGRGTGPARFV